VDFSARRLRELRARAFQRLRVPAADQLGFGQPHPVAAKNGRGVEEFIQQLLQEFPMPEQEIPVEMGICIAVMGRPNVGKSTLINRILGEERVIVFDEPGTTRDSISFTAS
jgi:GTP-binding protein